MEPITPESFLKRARSYKRFPVRFSPDLRRTAWASMKILVFTIIVYRALIISESVPNAFFFLVAKDELSSLLLWYQQSSLWLELISMVALFLGGVLALITNGFSEGEAALHWLTFMVSLVGAASAPLLIAMGAIFVLNIIVWLVLIASGFVVTSPVSYPVLKIIREIVRWSWKKVGSLT